MLFVFLIMTGYVWHHFLPNPFIFSSYLPHHASNQEPTFEEFELQDTNLAHEITLDFKEIMKL
jgi:hypothetical protein